MKEGEQHATEASKTIQLLVQQTEHRQIHETPGATITYRWGSANPPGGGCMAKWSGGKPSGGKPSGPGIGPGPTRGPPYMGGLPTPPLEISTKTN
jgi:hypothetical protein